MLSVVRKRSIFVFLLFSLNIAAWAEMNKAQHDTLTLNMIPNNDTLKVSSRSKGGFKCFVNKFFSFLSNFDSTYVETDKYLFAAKLSGNNSYQSIRFQCADEDGGAQMLQLKPGATFKSGPYLGWNGFFLGYTFDITHSTSSFQRSEFSISFYTAKFGIDLLYLKNVGGFTIDKISGFDKTIIKQVKNSTFDGLETYTASANAYYIFNNRHFSYPAAYGQNTIQRKSCGSWMLGFQYTHQQVLFDYKRLPLEMLSDNTELMEGFKFADLDYYNYTINVGYSYNWAFARNWLFNISLSPNIGLKRSKGERLLNENAFKNGFKNFSFDVVGRSGIVWNNNHFFCGLNGIIHLFDYRNKNLKMTNTYYSTSLYAGLFFCIKKQYK